MRNVPHLIFRKLPLDNFPHSAIRIPQNTRALILVLFTLDCMQGKVLSGKFRQYGRRVSRVRVRVSVKIRVRFRFICVGDPTCSHSLAV